MAFWDIDLTTRMGAQTAASQGAMGCFVFTGTVVLGIILLGANVGYTTPEGIGGMAAAGVEALIAVIAGLRMRAGKGVYWGMVAAALLIFEMITKIVSMTMISGLLFNGIVLVFIVKGIRGAWALRGEAHFEDNDVEIFE